MLRRLPTSRLLSLCALVAAMAVAIGAFAAGAFGGSGPVPPRKPLARAVHDALTAPSVQGVTASIDFTDKLIDTSGIRGANPLLSGASGRLWAAPRHLRLELQAPSGSEGAGDVQIVVNDRSFQLLDVASNTLYQGTLPPDTHAQRRTHESVPSVNAIQQDITRLARHVSIHGPARGDIAGEPAYSVMLSPKRNAGLVGHVTVSWDATKGVPLSVAIYARGATTPVLELRATGISFGPVPLSTFALNPLSHPHVVNVTPSGSQTHARKRHGKHAEVTGLRAVQAKVPFKLSAPGRLAGMNRSQVSLLGDGAAVEYGQGLGGILVLEQKHDAKAGQTPALPGAAARHAGRRSDLQLPTVKIGGANATEIATPLGTLIRFERGGVDYTVVGSVTKATAERAAQAL